MEAIQALLELHGEVIDRMLELMAARGEAGETTVRELAADEMIGGLLLLHGIHPVSLEDRIRTALEKVRPYLGSHGGDVELLEVREGVARLRLQGSCDGCPSSTQTLKYAIEKEVAEAAPDLVDLKVEGVVERPAVPAGFVPLAQIKPVPVATEADPWLAVAGVASLANDEVELREVAGVRVLFCRLGKTPYAYQDSCPACARTFENARLDGSVLGCAGCGRRYDIRRAGRCLDDDAQTLVPIPLLLEAGQVKVASAALGG